MPQTKRRDARSRDRARHTQGLQGRRVKNVATGVAAHGYSETARLQLRWRNTENQMQTGIKHLCSNERTSPGSCSRVANICTMASPLHQHQHWLCACHLEGRRCPLLSKIIYFSHDDIAALKLGCKTNLAVLSTVYAERGQPKLKPTFFPFLLLRWWHSDLPLHLSKCCTGQHIRK